MLILNRIVSDSFSTRGVLLFNRTPVCHTLELPYLSNSRDLSCIPDGTYRLTKGYNSFHARCFVVHDVVGRDGILIHTGNNILDTKGCILVGLDVNGDHLVNSSSAMKRLYSVVGDDEILNIRSV